MRANGCCRALCLGCIVTLCQCDTLLGSRNARADRLEPLHEVRVSVELENADRSLESHRHWIFENQVHVRRKDGSRAEHLGYEVYRQTTSGVGIGYLFDLGDAASEATFIYKSATAVVPNEVSFVIQDIALP